MSRFLKKHVCNIIIFAVIKVSCENYLEGSKTRPKEYEMSLYSHDLFKVRFFCSIFIAVVDVSIFQENYLEIRGQRECKEYGETSLAF